jgi:hypothetical protein
LVDLAEKFGQELATLKILTNGIECGNPHGLLQGIVNYEIVHTVYLDIGGKAQLC